MIYGGGNIGLMGAAADAALRAGGRVIGIMPRALLEYEVGHPGLTRLEIVNNMHRRKARMAHLSEAFIALPGGYGTFEELLEIVTWSQLNIQRKPVGILNVEGYYDPLLRLLDHAVGEGFIAPRHRELIVTSTGAAELLTLLEKPPPDVHAKVDAELRRTEVEAEASAGVRADSDLTE